MAEHQDIRYLVLFVTGRCNLKCRYCYATTAPQAVMPLEVAEAALNIAAASPAPFHVQLTGGEPCLYPSTIEAIASLIRRKNLNASIGIQTNGTLMDDALISMLLTYRVEIGLSLDGVESIHNFHRAKFRETIRGLTLLAKREVPCRVTAVVTRESAPHLDKTALMLGAFSNVQGLALDLLVQKRGVESNEAYPPSREALAQGTAALLLAMAFVNRNRTVPLILRETAQTAEKKLAPCHAARGESLSVYPDGRVFPCSQTAGDLLFDCGTLEDIQWERLKVTGPYGDCPSRTHYNRSSNLPLHETLLNAIAKPAQERTFQ
jgi:uncharacterized protein